MMEIFATAFCLHYLKVRQNQHNCREVGSLLKMCFCIAFKLENYLNFISSANSHAARSNLPFSRPKYFAFSIAQSVVSAQHYVLNYESPNTEKSVDREHQE